MSISNNIAVPARYYAKVKLRLLMPQSVQIAN